MGGEREAVDLAPPGFCGLGSPVTSGFNKCLNFPILYTQRNMLECVRLALSFPARHRLWGERHHILGWNLITGAILG